MNLSTIASLGSGLISGLMSLLSGAIAAGPWGFAAIGGSFAVLGGAAFFIYRIVVRYLNGKIDSRDQQNAGADAGNTAVDLANQAAAVRQGLDATQAAAPPVRPTAQEAKPK